MAKQKIAVYALLVVLIVSVAANIYLVYQNIELNKQLTSEQTHTDMTATLSAAQTSITAEVDRIGQSLTYASQRLSTTGLTGNQTDQILTDLAANSSFIINAATVNLQNIIVAAQPANWTYIKGRSVGEQTYLNPNPNGDLTPVMTPVIALQSDIMGNMLSAPVFNQNKQLTGIVSVVFDPSVLIGQASKAPLEGKDYELIGMQTDGLMIYDSDPGQQWRNMFTDPAYQDFTQLLELGHHVVNAPSGYGTYRFNLIGSDVVVHKECYWSTVWAYGQQWRLALNHALE